MQIDKIKGVFMNHLHRRILSKFLLFMAIFCIATHGGAARAQDSLPPPSLELKSVPFDLKGTPDTEVKRRPSFPANITIDDLNVYMNERERRFLSLEAFVALRKREPDLVVLDMRAPKDFARHHIEGSRNASVFLLMKEALKEILPDPAQTVVIVHEDSFDKSAATLPMSLPYVALRRNGYRNVYHLHLWRSSDGKLNHGAEHIQKTIKFSSIEKPIVDDVVPVTLSAEDFKVYLPDIGASVMSRSEFIALQQSAPPVAILDLRTQASFAARKINGSRLTTTTDMQPENLPQFLPRRDEKIILVYEHSFGPSNLIDVSMFAYVYLKKNGYTDVRRLSFCPHKACTAEYWAKTVGDVTAAQSGESEQTQTQAQTQPQASNIIALDPFGIPPAMSVEEFNKHMEGAREAALTLEGFTALRAAEPETVVLDTRSPAAYAYQRIKGSLNLPLTEMTEKTLPALLPDRARPVVLVCDESFGPTRRLSMTLQAWPVLKANGYTRVYRLNLWRPEAEGAPMHGQEEIEKHVPLEGTFKPQPSTP